MTPSRRVRGALLLPLLIAAACAPPVPVPLTPSPDPDAAPSELLSGSWWTVRIHSHEDPTRAQEVASGAAPRFDDPVTVVRAGGASHVHLGAFPSEERARAMLDVARAEGYRSAAVVRIARPPESERSPAP